MRLIAVMQRPGAGDRAVIAAVIAALIVLAAVPAVSDAEGQRSGRPLVCVAR
jgi:hypothetical protein